MPQQYSDNNPLDKQFRDKLSGTSVQPSGKVWKRIAGNLEQTNKRRIIGSKLFYLTLSAVAAAVITGVVLFVPGLTSRTIINNDKTVAVTSTKPFTDEKTTQASPVPVLVERPAPVSSHLPVKQSQENATSVKEQLSKLNSNLQSTLSFLNKAIEQVNNTSSATIRENEDILPLNPGIQGVAITPVSIPHSIEVESYSITSNDLATNEIQPLEKAKIQSSVCIKGLYAGVDLALNNPWLIDKKALANYNFTYRATLGMALGIKVGYNISNRIGIETGCNIISQEGQNYTFSPPVFARVEPSNVDNRVKLTYTQVPLLAKFKFAKTSGLTHHTVVLNYSLGAEYGVLHSIDNTVNDENAEYVNFKRSELAVVAGIGYDIYVSSKVFLSGGIQASYSSSLYNTSPVSPYDQFSAPHSLVGGIHLGINYAITGCR